VWLFVGEVERGTIGDAQPVGKSCRRSVLCPDPLDGDDVARLQAAAFRQPGSELPNPTRARKLEHPMLDGVLIASDIDADVRVRIHPLYSGDRPGHRNWFVEIEYRLNRMVSRCGDSCGGHRRRDYYAGE
jgi:hypothetical protein